MKKISIFLMMLCLACFGVANAQQRLPYSYGFEDNNLATDGWTTQNPSGLDDSKFMISSSAKRTGDYGFQFSSYSDNGAHTQYLISPELDAANGVIAQFYYKASSSYGTETFKVGYSTTNTDITSFTFGSEISTSNTSWTQSEEFTFPAGTKYVAIYYYSNYLYYLYVDDFSFEEALPCAKPENLSVTTDGQTATVTWDGTASNGFIVNIDGTDYTVQTSSYTFNVALSTTYNISVTANCGSDGLSSPVSTSFTTPDCLGGHTINYALTDSFGDGWNGNAINIVDECGNIIETLTIASGSSNNGTLSLCGDYYQFTWTAGSYASETSFTLTVNGVLYSSQSGSSLTDGQVLYTIGTNTRLPRPTALTAGTPSARQVELSWTENGTATAWQICVNGDETNLIDAGRNPFTLASLTPDTDYTAKVRAIDRNDESCWSDEISFHTAETCAKPTNLAVTTDGRTATVTWEGSASTYNIDINGTVIENVTSPYTFDVELTTTYTVMVQANCTSEPSNWTDAYSFTTPDCIGGHTINYTLTDSYNDGWEGAYITVIEGCGDVVATLTVANGESPKTGTLTLCGDYYEFVYTQGQYPSEYGWTFTEGGTTLFSGAGNSSSNGQVLYTIGTQAMPKPTDLTAGTPEAHSVALSWTENGTATAWQICVNGDENNLIDVTGRPSYTLDRLASETAYTVKVRSTDRTGESCWSAAVTFTTAESSCAKPTSLAESNISFTTADLSWNGTSNSYVLQYRPWYPAGEDIIATGVTTTYTVDLSAYEGTGSVAIRHYDIYDMFRLNVDDIVVTNAAGQVVFSEDFESGVMPSTFNNMDLDGDGYVWEVVTNGNDSHGNPTGNGTYCMASASYDNNYGVLYPDNWIIMSGLEMGGQISFAARGQDPAYAAENFAIYVSTDNSIVEIPVSATTYSPTDLTPNTPYAWQVKGVCSDEESSFASSFFKTQNDVWTFVTAGNWNDASNWLDHEGNATTVLPTAENNVRIDADAIIPANYVAYANKATIGTGTITIEDGGQLKQNSASLRVTMEKEIAAVGEDNWTSDNNSGYYFIASPFNGRTLYQASGSFSHVDNMLTGEYDLYAFDATADLEWINYKSNPTHIAFQGETTSSGSGLTGLLYGEGYLYASKEGTTIEFEGTAGKSNNYSETKDYTFASESYDFNGWALVGNFFTCNAYINYVDANGDALEANFYTMDPVNGYTLSASNVSLAPCTGALINYSATGKVQYSTEAPAGNKTGMINMTLSCANKNVDQARVRFGHGYNMQHKSFRNNSKVYMPVDGQDYAVVYTEGNNGEMPVSFKAEENGTYTLSFNTENVELGYLHLIDNMNGNEVDLLSTPSYTFEASTTDYASRFRLVFATGNADDNFAFYSNGSFVINNEGNATLQVIDVNGRILKSESINGCTNIDMNTAAGVYMLRLVNGDNVKVQKVVVR